MKIIIRELRTEDSKISWKWRNDPEVWKLTGRQWNGKVTEKIEENWIKDVIKQKDSKRFAICVGENELYIGNLQLTNIKNKQAIFHIFIGDKQYWGKGIGTIATKLLISYVEERLKINTIKLFVRKDNHAAIKIYKRVGFTIDKSVNEEKYLMTLTIDR